MWRRVIVQRDSRQTVMCAKIDDGRRDVAKNNPRTQNN